MKHFTLALLLCSLFYALQCCNSSFHFAEPFLAFPLEVTPLLRTLEDTPINGEDQVMCKEIVLEYLSQQGSRMDSIEKFRMGLESYQALFIDRMYEKMIQILQVSTTIADIKKSEALRKIFNYEHYRLLAFQELSGQY